jgi:multidrug efflux pump subunit AcrB
MTLTQLTFRYRAVAGVLASLLLGIGLFALFSLPRREDPDLKARFVQVIALYPGASAAQVEQLATERLERALQEVDDVKTVTSTSRPGIAVLQIEAADRMTGTLDRFMDDLRKRVADLRPSLPTGVIDVAVNDRFADTAALIFGVTEPNATPNQLEDHARRLRDRLRLLPEVAECHLLGVQPETVTVALSSPRLAAYQGTVTIDGIAAALSSKTLLPETGGSVRAGTTRLTLTPADAGTDLFALESLVIGQGGGETAPIALRDVATVTRGSADPPATLLRIDGQPAVGVTVSMRKGHNIQALGERAQAVVALVQATLPPGARIHTVNDLPRSVARRVGGFFHELLLAVGIIVAVMLLFMGPRSALLVGAMLPLSMLGTFAAMLMAGREIQQMSIAALIIALALVVDNAIVVLDNIEEKLSAGMERTAAAIAGADEIRGPLVTANLVAISSFLPLAFLPGGVGDFIRDLGLVTALALAVSVLLNLTLLPLLCAAFLRATHTERRTAVQRWMDRLVDNLRDGKATLAQRALARPGPVVALAALALAGSVSLIPKLGLQFFPSAERDQFVVDVWLPEGRDIRATEAVAKQVERLVTRQPGVVSTVAYIGEGGPRFYYNVSPEAPAANYAQLVVNTRSLSITDGLVTAVQRAALAEIADARVTARRLEQGPPIGAPIAIRLTGDSVATLRQRAEMVKRRLAAIPGAQSVFDSYGELPLRLSVMVDEDRVALAGLSRALVAQTARLAFSGQTVALLREGDTEVPIVLRLAKDERSAPSDLPNLYLPGGVSLRQVATIALAPGDARIVRRNGERTLTVSAFSDGSRLPSAILADIQASLTRDPLPPDVSVAYGGESEETNRTFGDMVIVFAAAAAFTVIVLTIQFGSLPLLLAVLSAVPLGVIGAVPGLYLAHQNFGFMAFLGIAALGGIVTNHTIFLFHYAQEERVRRTIPMTEALVDASRRRLRPILLTVLLSIGALLPQAYSGSKLWPPLDWAIISGLLVSTFLTMIVVPSVFAVLSGRRTRRVVPAAVVQSR